MSDAQIRMEVAYSRPDHLPTLSAAKTSELSLLFIGCGPAVAGNATPTFCYRVPAISNLITLTVTSLCTAPTETAKHHIVAIDEASSQQQHLRAILLSGQSLIRLMAV